MPILPFSKFMFYQRKAILASGLDVLLWIDKKAAHFRREVERRYIIR